MPAFFWFHPFIVARRCSTFSLSLSLSLSCKKKKRERKRFYIERRRAENETIYCNVKTQEEVRVQDAFTPGENDGTERERETPPSEKIKKETQTVKMRGTEAVNVATTSYRPTRKTKLNTETNTRRCEQKHLLRIRPQFRTAHYFVTRQSLCIYIYIYTHRSECISSSSNSRYGLL